mgnify:CR=1 FL=1
MDEENHPSQDDENQETEIGNEEVTENEEQASSENEEALEEAPQDEDNSDANEDDKEGQEPEAVEEQQPRKQSRTSKRIQQLNAQKNEALQRAERAEQQLKQFQENNTGNEEEYDEYDLNSIVEKTARKTAEITQQQSVTNAKQEVAHLEAQELTAKVEAFQEAETELMAKVPDYEEAVSQVGFLAENQAVTSMILESDKGAEVTYYLAKNPNEARQVAQMSPLQAAKFIGGVEAKLTPPTPKKATTAPKPVPKISGKSGSQSKDPSKMSMKEYEKWRMGNS